jgi:hypothetical protein
MKHLISIALIAASASALAQSSVEIKDPCPSRRPPAPSCS